MAYIKNGNLTLIIVSGDGESVAGILYNGLRKVTDRIDWRTTDPVEAYRRALLVFALSQK